MKTILLDQAEFIVARTRTALKKHGIETINDLFNDFPTRYENYHVSSIKEAKLETPIVLEGSIVSKITVSYLKSKLTALNFLLEVEGQILKATIFNRVFLKSKLDYGTVIKASGKFMKSLNNFTISELILCDEINRDIVPIYKNKDISEAKYVEIMDKCFRRYGEFITETLPDSYIQKHNLISLKTATKYLHVPETLEQIEIGLNRLKTTLENII